MNDRENRRQSQSQNTGAGSRQQEQATAGGSMNEDTEDQSMEQEGGTYRPAGDRGLDFESHHSGEFDIGDGRPAGTASEPDSFERDRQPEQSNPEMRRQAVQQEGAIQQSSESDPANENR